jgi:hypothetical protein
VVVLRFRASKLRLRGLTRVFDISRPTRIISTSRMLSFDLVYTRYVLEPRRRSCTRAL